ncbi:PspC domain-containing protein [Arthrobacter sp. C9C5]|uniref:PspC domain-containing protein n=1 Tax=Arthrobacter sp. C9C5 TaxID=2735267 RepID=UPI0015846C8B|nr:PspC domain-containing protein [Arthrobacter sp. C9C5]NUU30327.1 PspC domain-containing protein [Arthrobacter sp. C9C5]
MNPHTPHPDEDPNASGRPDSTPDATYGGPADTTAAAGEPAQEAPPLYPPGGPYPSGPGATPPPYTGAPRAPGAQPQDFFDWIRSHGIFRGRQRWVGGVASGIAQRLGVDPLIVRGILIVLTVFAGVGVLFYGLAWALLPEPDGRIHVQEAAAGRWSSGMTGALITTIIGFPSLGSGVWGWDRYGFGAFVWTVFWVGGAIYVIYYLTQRNKARAGGTPMSPGSRPGGAGWSAAGADTYGSTYGGAGPAPTVTNQTLPLEGLPARNWENHSEAAPGWAAPPPSGPIPPYGGGYGPVPPTAPVPAPKPRNLGPGASAVAVTAGIALLVGGGIKALDAAHAINLGTAGNAVVWASAAAVLGLGILVSGLRGRTAGILGFFAVVALIIGGIFNLVPNADRARFQNIDWAPASIEQARDGFDITGGTGTVDLTKLNLNPPLGSDVVVRLDATASNVTVAIPASVPVQVQADMTMGNLSDSRGNHGGMTTQQNDYNTDKPGSRLIVKISGTLSNITVKEGN